MATELYKGAAVRGCGMYVPENIVSNNDLIKIHDLNTTPEWIKDRTGIETRRINDNPKMATSDMAVRAARLALDDAEVKPSRVDRIILATVTPDFWFPATACIVQAQLGADHASAFDINAGCSGFLYGMDLAIKDIETGRAKNVLVIGAEMLSRIVNWKDRSTSVLFGDGAGALLMSASEGLVTRPVVNLGSDGSKAEILWIPAGGTRNPLTIDALLADRHTIHMKGKPLYKTAITEMVHSSAKTMKEAGITRSHIHLTIPHQANGRMIDEMAAKTKLTMFKNIDRYGNTSAASIPIALSEADENGIIHPGDRLLLVSFGAGLTWGSIYLKWKEGQQETPPLSVFERIESRLRNVLRRVTFYMPFPKIHLAEVPVSQENTN